MLLDQRPGVVQQQALRHAAEVRECRLDAPQPAALALIVEGHDEIAPRVAQGRHEQVHPHHLAADHDPLLAEVDLQLLTRRGLKTHRRPRLGGQLTTPWRHRALDRAQRDLDLLLGQQLLTKHLGVAAVTPKALPQPLLQARQPRAPLGTAVRHPAPSGQVTLNRVATHTELAGDPPRSPTLRLQRQHRCDLLGLAHQLPSLAYRQRRAVVPNTRHRLFPSVCGGHFSMSAGGQFFMSPDRNACLACQVSQ